MPESKYLTEPFIDGDKPHLCLLGRDDLKAVAALEADAFSSPATVSQYEALLESSCFKMLGLKRNTALLGYVSATLIPAASELEIYNIAVLPECRKKGYGATLLGSLIRIAVEAGIQRAVLEVREGNTPALALYHAFGFTPCGRRKKYYSNPTEDALIYEKVLKSFS